MESSPSYTDKYLTISPDTENRLMRTIRLVSVLLLLLGLTVALGWFNFNMKLPNSLSFILVGGALFLMTHSRIKQSDKSKKQILLARMLATAVTLMAFANILQYAFNINLGQEKEITTLITPISSICFILLGLSLLLEVRKNNETMSQALSFMSLLLSYAIFVAYLFDAPHLSHHESLRIMSIHSSFALLIASVACLLFFHDHRLIAIVISSTPAGAATRKILPVIFLAPALLGWIRWEFLQSPWLQGSMTTAVFSTIMVGILSFVANHLAWKIHEQYHHKLETESTIQAQKELWIWRERLVSTLVHDLRSPLTTANLLAQRLERKKELTPAQVQETGARISTAINRGDRLLRDLLDSTQATYGILPTLSLNKCELNSLLENFIKSIGNDKKNIRLICEDHLDGMWDEDAIVRIVENLVSNAMKYGDPQSVVTVLGKRKSQDMICIEVHNIGSVITQAQQEGIFELFSRQNHHQQRPGWGIGLTVVRTLTAAMGGHVYVQSSAEIGTTFTVELPVNISNTEFKKTG